MSENSIALQRYLTGAIFPATKDTVVATLQRNAAPGDLVGKVQSDDMTRYVSPAAVSHVWRRAQ